MSDICMQCHGKACTDGHFSQMGRTVEEYNEVYFKPAKQMLDDCYARTLLDSSRFLLRRWKWNITNSGIMKAGGREWGRP